MRSNLDVEKLISCALLAKDIREWSVSKSHPEKYQNVKDLEQIRDFIHRLDLLETVLTRFEISTYFAQQALNQVEQSEGEGSLAWEFNQIDIEEFFASNLLELCYQLSNAWKELHKYAEKDKAFLIFNKKLPKSPDALIARHHATHFDPDHFQGHRIARKYSILRRPYEVVDGNLVKELAKFTMPRVGILLKDSVEESYRYLTLFREATIK